jgi:hypothetical protein
VRNLVGLCTDIVREGPDFKMGNLCVEVKSCYTAGLDGNKEMRRDLVDKMTGVKEAGYDFLLLVMNKDGTLNCCCFNSFRIEYNLDQFVPRIQLSAITHSLL